ncbi:MAG TPA: hypothetical protein VMR31_03360 [Myxococcota bacterium]|nr:hypothetical protein [Myxococcota bacterium]
MARRLAPALALTALAGCASFSEAPPPPAAPPPVASPPLAVHFTGSEQATFDWGLGPEEIPESGLAAAARDAIWASGWVKETREAGFGRMLKLDVAHRHKDTLTLVSLFTVLLYPTREDEHVELELSFLEVGRAKQTCARSADVSTWHEAFLIFVAPFHWPGSMRRELARSLALSCLAEVLEKREAAGAQ